MSKTVPMPVRRSRRSSNFVTAGDTFNIDALIAELDQRGANSTVVRARFAPFANEDLIVDGQRLRAA